MNFYVLLGLGQDASTADIKRAYRRLARPVRAAAGFARLKDDARTARRRGPFGGRAATWCSRSPVPRAAEPGVSASNDAPRAARRDMPCAATQLPFMCLLAPPTAAGLGWPGVVMPADTADLRVIST
ncbi:MAG: J domain-containing protein [Acidobacteria bacterium]|nr:J domain-containing protein [Acidobacteriota bacterium]